MPRAGSDELLANLGWVRRLALAIVRDANAADDVTQEVARVALEHEPQVPDHGLRAWLGAVTRRLALDRTRSDAARRARERSVARPEGDGSAAEVVERGARQQRVARAVMDLAEPYRSTILYRYLDELPIAEVARRTHVNEVAARKRLSRGLEMLRARLDAEFGTSTRNWIVAMVAPAKGALLMSTKWIAAGAAAVVLGLGWWGWRSSIGQAATPIVQSPAVSARLATPAVDPVATAPESQAAREPLANVVAPPVRAPAAEPSDPASTVLHVRVVDSAGSAVSQGVIECRWTASPKVAASTSPTAVEASIHSETTDVRLPEGAVEAVVRAFGGDHLATQAVTVRNLRKDATGHAGRDVVLTLDQRSFEGVVKVDGQRKIPDGLTIRCTLEHKEPQVARIETSGSTYALSGVGAGSQLWITSAETVPMQLVVKPDAVSAGEMDIDLSAARTLRLTFVDKQSGRPLSGLGIIVTRSVHLEGPVSSGDALAFRTDARGRCDVHGIATDMLVGVYPDLQADSRTSQVVVGGSFGHGPPAAWWHERVPSAPAVIEVELHVTQLFPGADAFGLLPPGQAARASDRASALIVKARELVDSPTAYPFELGLDESGRWDLRAPWPSRFEIWLEHAKDHAVVSRKVMVKLDHAGEIGPIDLPLAAPEELGTDVEVRLVHVPAGATVDLSLQEEGHPGFRTEALDCKGPTCTHHLRLKAPASIHATAFLNQANFGSEVRRTVPIDPARDSTCTIDMGGEEMRTVEVSMRGAKLPDYVVLGIARLDQDGTKLSEATSTTLLQGRATAPISIAPGRWFFECFDPQRDFNVTGIIDVTAGTGTLSIARDVLSVERSSFPHGIEFTNLDGVDLTGLERPIRYPSTSAEGSVILNATARYVALP